MSSINHIGGNQPVSKIQSNPVAKSTSTDKPEGTQRASDRVELSGVSHLLKSLQSNDVRAEKVAQIKQAIADGKYDDDHKLDVAADRLLDDLLK